MLEVRASANSFIVALHPRSKILGDANAEQNHKRHCRLAWYQWRLGLAEEELAKAHEELERYYEVVEEALSVDLKRAILALKHKTLPRSINCDRPPRDLTSLNLATLPIVPSHPQRRVA